MLQFILGKLATEVVEAVAEKAIDTLVGKVDKPEFEDKHGALCKALIKETKATSKKVETARSINSAAKRNKQKRFKRNRR